jgi:hypothetical protein
MHSEGGLHISGIKPFGLLVLHRVDQSVFEELFLFVLTKLNPAPTQNRSIITLEVRFQTEKITKKSDGRKNTRKASQKCMKIEGWRTPLGVRWFKDMAKNQRKRWRKREAGRHKPA